MQPTTPSKSTQEIEGQNESSTQKCSIFSSSSAQTPSAELTVQAAFFSACFFRQMWQLLEFLSSDSFC
ncbi:hypothetical protein FF2_024363 [Malus domestica]